MALLECFGARLVTISDSSAIKKAWESLRILHCSGAMGFNAQQLDLGHCRCRFGCQLACVKLPVGLCCEHREMARASKKHINPYGVSTVWVPWLVASSSVLLSAAGVYLSS